MVRALVNTRVMKTFAEFFKDLVGSNVTLAAISLLRESAVLSVIVDNNPYVASMSPVVLRYTKRFQRVLKRFCGGHLLLVLIWE